MPIPYSVHPLAWGVAVACLGAYWLALHRLGPIHSPTSKAATAGQVAAYLGGVFALWAAMAWPVADLSRDISAIAHVAQQLLLVMAVPPLILLGLPRWLLALGASSPRAEAALRIITHPVVAIVVFNVALVAAWLPPVVAAEARWAGVADADHLCLLIAGFVMWIPATRLVPGTRPLSVAARIGYLFAQSVVFNFPALILIFAHNPLYPVYASHVHAVLGIDGRTDQQIAGAVAKVIGFGTLIGAAAIILNRGWRAEEQGADPDPLLWEDVERELRRLERRSKGTTDAS